MSQIQQKLLAHEALLCKWSPVFSKKNGLIVIVPLGQRRTVNSEWYTTICLAVVFQEIRKTNRRSWINFHHDNASSHTSAQTTAFLITQNINRSIVLTWHWMTSFCSRTKKVKWEVNVFRHLKKRLMRSECIFWSYLNHSGKIASTICSNTCKTVQILMGNILKSNKAIFDN